MQGVLIFIAEIAKYIITGLLVAYTATGLVSLCYPREQQRRYLGNIQSILLFLSQVFCFFSLVMNSDDGQYWFFYLFIQVFLLTALTLVPLIYENVNRLLLNNMCMLLGIGLCMISRLSFAKAIRQYVIVLFSFMISMFLPIVFSKIRFLRRLTWIYGLLGITLLSIVLVFGELTHGSKISFGIAGVMFQPSEFVKILFLFFLAGALWESTSFFQVAATALVAGAHVIVLVISTDLGSALIFFAGYVLVVFIATRNYWYLLAGAFGGSVAAVIAYHLFDHVRIRVMAWQDPWRYIDDQGFQITQSLFAVGSGSWFGMGLLKGNPKAIPFVDADFIFSSICEELGVISGICVILICLTGFFMMMKIALQIPDRFYQIIVYGIAVMYAFQIFLTIGGGIKYIPLTGVTLPFISYGGSSVMTTMFMYFIIQGIYIRLQYESSKSAFYRERESYKEYTDRNDEELIIEEIQ